MIVKESTTDFINRMMTKLEDAGIDTTNSHVANALTSIVAAELADANDKLFEADRESKADTATTLDSLTKIANQFGIITLPTDTTDTLRYKIKNHRREQSYGSLFSIRRAALSVPGVSNVNVVSQFFGPATVGVFVEAQNHTIPSADLLAQVKEIVSAADGGVHIEVSAPEYIEVLVRCTIKDLIDVSNITAIVNKTITESNIGDTINLTRMLSNISSSIVVDSVYLNGRKTRSKIIQLKENEKAIIDRTKDTSIEIRVTAG